MTTQSVRCDQGGARDRRNRHERHRTVVVGLAAFLVLAGLVIVGQVGRARAATALRPSIAVPAYFWADDQWGRMLNGATEVRYVVLNPESGPGSVKYASFETKVTAARSQGATVLGYVDTAYGARPNALVQADITKYRNWYGINAFFFDQTPTACSELPYYDALSTFVRSQPNGLVFHNPGTNPSECFLGAADVVVNFEGSEATYAGWTPSAYAASYPASRFWHIIYSVDPSHATALLDGASSRQGGVVYLTEQGMPNPFSVIPTPALWSAQTPSVTTRPPAPQAGSGTTVPGRTPAPQSGTETTTTTPTSAVPVWAVGAPVAPPPSTTVATVVTVAPMAPALLEPVSSVPTVEASLVEVAITPTPPTTTVAPPTTSAAPPTTTVALEVTAPAITISIPAAAPAISTEPVAVAGPALVSNIGETGPTRVSRAVRTNRRNVASARGKRSASRVDSDRRIA